MNKIKVNEFYALSRKLLRVMAILIFKRPVISRSMEAMHLIQLNDYVLLTQVVPVMAAESFCSLYLSEMPGAAHGVVAVKLVTNKQIV